MEKEMSIQEREELALKLLASLPRSRLAAVQERITPLLQFDVVGNLPSEVALLVFAHLPYQSLLLCSLINRRWYELANDQSLWKHLCAQRGWAWRQAPRQALNNPGSSHHRDHSDQLYDDEGIGDSDDSDEGGMVAGLTSSSPLPGSVEEAKAKLSKMYAQLDSKLSRSRPRSSTTIKPNPRPRPRLPTQLEFSAHPESKINRRQNYKLLYLTHIRLRNRFLTTSYRLSHLQTKGSLNTGGHTTMIYCLQLYNDPETGQQTLFTGSRDRSVREWNLTTRTVVRVIGGIHWSSVLSLCACDGYLATAGSDKQVALYDLRKDRLLGVIADHEDSVLCVRFNEEYLVSCSKDRTVRVYAFPSLQPLHVLDEHRAAVNTVSLSGSYIFTGSGDRSIRLWDAKTGQLLRTFDNHHTRGIASIDFKPPLVVSGSSDKHVRLFDVTTLQGWSTSPEHGHPVNSTSQPHDTPPLPFPPAPQSPTVVDQACPYCGSCQQLPLSTEAGPLAGIARTRAGQPNAHTRLIPRQHAHSRGVPAAYPAPLPVPTPSHNGLVRSVLLSPDFVISGSYDLSIKVWDRNTGALIADLEEGHAGRIFCVAADCTKIVSCGEDQTICIWDFGHGMDTSFVQL